MSERVSEWVWVWGVWAEQTHDTEQLGERALKNMMGGKLATDKDKKGPKVLVQPEWMKGDRGAMSEEQLRQLKEWEVQLKRFLEEQLKEQQVLAAELKKCKADATDVRTKFQSAFTSLQRERLTAQAGVYDVETQVVALAAAVERCTESDAAQQAALEAAAVVATTKKAEAAEALAAFRAHHEEAKAAAEAAAAEDKALERSFKRDVAAADPHTEALMKLYRLRKRETDKAPARQVRRGSITAAAATGGATAAAAAAEAVAANRAPAAPPGKVLGGMGAPLDPFTGLVELPVDTTVTADALLESEAPEGLEASWWERLLTARDAKVLVESTVEATSQVAKAAAEHLAQLEAADAAAGAALEGVYTELQAIRKHRFTSRLDLQVPLYLKQGQMEVDLSGATLDLSDAILLDRQVVEAINEVVTKSGAAKLETLEAIKEFKKGIYDGLWLSQKLSMDDVDLVHRIKDLQLLRVTKKLQEVLRTGDDSKAAAEAAAMEKGAAVAARTHGKSVVKAKAAYRKTLRGVRERAAQNDVIQSQIFEMGAHVAEQLRIKADRPQEDHQAQAGAGEVAERRMRAMVTQRKLATIAKAQAEETLLLREELERLRLRTFPSFVERRPALQLKRAPGPDDR